MAGIRGPSFGATRYGYGDWRDGSSDYRADGRGADPDATPDAHATTQKHTGNPTHHHADAQTDESGCRSGPLAERSGRSLP